MHGDSVNVIDGSTFLVSDGRGDADARRPSRQTDGLYYRDTRHLSVFHLSVGGAELELLATNDSEYYAASFFLALDPGSAQRFHSSAEVSVIRHRNLLGVLRERVTLQNHSHREVSLELRFRLAADFADLFEVKDDRLQKSGSLERSHTGSAVHFLYVRDGFRRRTEVGFRLPERARLRVHDPEDADEPVVATVALAVPARSESTLALEVSPYDGGEEPRRRLGLAQARSALRSDLHQWREGSPRLHSGREALKGGWARSIDDLAALRYVTDDGERVVAAGLPWFMALFGRDSLISGYQTVMVQPDLSRGILRALARRQATDLDDFTDAEPGKILHELRLGEMTRFGASPHKPYYGTVDATPLFLILLHETWRWGADDDLVQELEGAARAALRWISDHGDSDGDGYVDYRRRSAAGLANQGWKDSPDAVLFADGSPAEGSIALCEVQGYVYDAWLRSAELAERVWGDEALAGDLRRRAEDLERRFDRDFWMPDRGYYALALDGEGRRVDSITSNAGHLLWSGLVPERRAGAVVECLMDPEALFSGWGIRTMSKGDAGYNPIAYHNGTVWPHDNALIVHGLRRYGYGAEASRVASALVEAAASFDYRLPEVFAGYDRAETDFPVRYPTASSPQAWASGTIPLLVRSVLGARPDPERKQLTAAVELPRGFSDVVLRGVPAFGRRFDVSARGVSPS